MNQGVVIVEVSDIILEVNKYEVNSAEDFREAYKHSGRDNTLLLVYRNGRAFYLVLGK